MLFKQIERIAIGQSWRLSCLITSIRLYNVFHASPVTKVCVAISKNMGCLLHFCSFFLLFPLRHVSSCSDGKFPARFSGKILIFCLSQQLTQFFIDIHTGINLAWKMSDNIGHCSLWMTCSLKLHQIPKNVLKMFVWKFSALASFHLPFIVRHSFRH